ncbi:MAG: Rrf2 family transcriptional regulator [Methylotenera sp.]|nr:Rrf2 family transcriptional regulator [Methylotenera sp.]
MQLTQYSDIGLRLLMYLANERREAPAITLAEVSNQFNIPRNHLAKVAGKLVKYSWIEAIRGRSGGLRLAIEPSNINIGQVLRVLEGHTEVINCEKLQCKLKAGCELKIALANAYEAFFNVLDQHTLADVTNGLAATEIVKMHKGFMQIYLDSSTVH